MRAAVVRRFILAILATANVILVAILKFGRTDAPSPQVPGEERLPALNVVADTGRHVLLSSLTGKAVVVE